MIKERANWIDWMKALCMLIVVWGHCFPKGLEPFIYAFNVPVFFVISGYLSHREESWKLFCKKSWTNLILPYLLICIIKDAGFMVKHITDIQSLQSLGLILTGFHSYEGIPGCGNLWFVYTIIIARIIVQMLKTDKLLIVFTILMIGGGIAMHTFGMSISWAISNLLFAWPFFYIGSLCRKNKEEIALAVNKISHMNTILLILAIALAITSVTICGHFNGFVKMYKCECGNNYFLFLLGGIVGTIMMFVISARLNSLKSKAIYLISIGTIVILGFHRDLNHPLLKIVDSMDFNVATNGIVTFLVALLVTLAFVPIIWIISRYLPIFIGKRSTKQ